MTRYRSGTHGRFYRSSTRAFPYIICGVIFCLNCIVHGSQFAYYINLSGNNGIGFSVLSITELNLCMRAVVDCLVD